MRCLSAEGWSSTQSCLLRSFPFAEKGGGDGPDGCCFALIGGQSDIAPHSNRLLLRNPGRFLANRANEKIRRGPSPTFFSLRTESVESTPWSLSTFSCKTRKQSKHLLIASRIVRSRYHLYLTQDSVAVCWISMIDMLFYSCPMVVHFIIGWCRA
jgi:hypothetical protein